MDKQEYAKCIEDDIDFLKRNLPESLFKCLWSGHIIDVLKASIDMIYDQPSLPSNLLEAKHAFSEKRFPNEKMAPLRRAARIGYEAGAEWMAEQGVSMAITDDTEWADVDKFVHSNCDGASIIQIRKKD